MHNNSYYFPSFHASIYTGDTLVKNGKSYKVTGLDGTNLVLHVTDSNRKNSKIKGSLNVEKFDVSTKTWYLK